MHTQWAWSSPIQATYTSHNGGLVIFICYKPVLSGSNDLELSIVSVHKDNCRVCIALFYRSHSSPFCTFDNFYIILHPLDLALFSNFVLFGDFNIDFLPPPPIVPQAYYLDVFFLSDSQSP